jgi:hypothetical protein
VTADLFFRIVLGGLLFSALGAVLWMMFHGRQFLSDALLREFREGQRIRHRQLTEIYGTREACWILVFLVVMAVGLTMTRNEFWETTSWMSRLGMIARNSPMCVVIGSLILFHRFKSKSQTTLLGKHDLRPPKGETAAKLEKLEERRNEESWESFEAAVGTEALEKNEKKFESDEITCQDIDLAEARAAGILPIVYTRNEKD